MISVKKKLRIGWQTGMTYQAPKPMDKDYLFCLLDRMAENGMNFLSIMPESMGRFDPSHDGICWPTDNARLLSLQDKLSPNSYWETEFLSEGINYAKSLGIDVNIMLHWHMVNHERLLKVYPDIGKSAGIDNLDLYKTCCSKNSSMLNYFLELLADVCQLYAKNGIHSITVEGPFAEWCGSCLSCLRWYEQTTGTQNPNENMRILADNLKMRDILKKISATIKSTSPSVEFWVHSGPWSKRGHQPDTLLKGGVDCLMNYFCHDLYEPEAMSSIMDFVNPLPCCPQTCVRDKATNNYFVKTKTPEDAGRYARSILETVEKAPNGIGAVFFNEIYLSEANRTAVYDECGRYVKDRI